MHWLRIAYRLPGFAAITLVLYTLRIAPLLLPAFRGETDRAWRSRMFRLWARLLCRLIRMRVHVDGPLPKQYTFVVTNHLGYVDVLLLASFLPGVFVAKSEIARWPFLGRVVRGVGTIFVDRNHKRDLMVANDRIVEAVERGESIVLFAEGTSSCGERVLPMKPSLLDVPATRSLPVTYGAIRYETPAGAPNASEAVCWWGDEAFFPHLLTLLGLPGFDAYLRFGPQAVIEPDRKRLALRLQESISAELAAVG